MWSPRPGKEGKRTEAAVVLLKELREEPGGGFLRAIESPRERQGIRDGGGSRDRDGGKVRGDLQVKSVELAEWLDVGY